MSKIKFDNNGNPILNQIPLQQGLKLHIKFIKVEKIDDSKSNSTTTRIETSKK